MGAAPPFPLSCTPALLPCRKIPAAMSPSQHSGCLGRQILATPKYPRDRLLCDGRQLPWKPPSNKKKKKEKNPPKFKAALVAQRNWRPYYGFWQPPFFFYLFQLKAPGDKAISLASQGEWESEGTVLGASFPGWQAPGASRCRCPAANKCPPPTGLLRHGGGGRVVF